MITTLTGENAFLVKEAIDKAAKKFLQDNDELGLERIDGEEADFERIKEAMLTIPLFAPTKLVIVRNAHANKQLMESLEYIIGATPESTDVILVIPKPDKRAKYHKILKQKTDYKELGVLDTRSLSSWVTESAKQLGASVSQADAQYLVNRVGPNQAQLQRELEKLTLKTAQITRADIDDLTEAQPQSTVFELLDAAFAGNHKKALAIYEEQRRLKTEPLAIVGMIAWQLHILAIVATAKGKSPAEIAKEAKVHPFVISKSKGVLNKLSYAHLKKLIADALELDIQLKSQAINADDALKHYLLSCSVTISS